MLAAMNERDEGKNFTFLFQGDSITDGGNWTSWSSEMKVRQGIARQLAEETGALFVPFQELFDKACACRIYMCEN